MLRSIALLTACLPALAGCAGGECQMVLASPVPLTLTQDGTRMSIPVLMDQTVPLTLVVDTGSDNTMLDEQAVGFHGATNEPVVMRGIGGTRMGSYAFNRLQIGRLAGTLGAVTADVPWMRKDGYSGLLGMDVLGAYDVDFNLAANELRLMKTQGDCSKPHAALAPALYEVPELPSSDGQPSLHVTIAGQQLVAVLDTGAPDTVLSGRAARRLGLTGSQVAADETGYALGVGRRKEKAHRHLIDAIEIGDLILRHVPVTVLNAQFDEHVDMLLGMDFVRRVHLWLSNSSHTIILQLPPRPSPPVQVTGG